MKPPLIHTPQRPPQPEVHTTGCPSQNSAGFGGAQLGGCSPWTGAGGGGAGSALASAAPTPSTAAKSPPATATAGRVVLIKAMSMTPALRVSGCLADITTLRWRNVVDSTRPANDRTSRKLRAPNSSNTLRYNASRTIRAIWEAAARRVHSLPE